MSLWMTKAPLKSPPYSCIFLPQWHFGQGLGLGLGHLAVQILKKIAHKLVQIDTLHNLNEGQHLQLVKVLE